MTEFVSVLIMFAVGTVMYGFMFYFLFATIKSFKKKLWEIKVAKQYRDHCNFYINRRKEMLERGEQHEWVNIKSAVDPSKEMMICKKTGWCPEIKDYFSDEWVRKQIKKQELAEQYKMYRDIEVGTLAVRYKLDLETMEKIVEDVFNIKKSFHLKHIEKQMKENM